MFEGPDGIWDCVWLFRGVVGGGLPFTRGCCGLEGVWDWDWDWELVKLGARLGEEGGRKNGLVVWRVGVGHFVVGSS